MSKVAILTNFGEFMPGYSLTGVVLDQARMLARHGHEVHLYVLETFSGAEPPHGVILEKKVPFAHLFDYRTRKELSPDHKVISEKISLMLQSEMRQFDHVLTHDWIFTGWNLPHALGLVEATNAMRNDPTTWFHWVHSVPSGGRDWWKIKAYGPKSKLIFPNQTDSLFVAERFQGGLEDIRVIHHIKDPRTFCDFCPDTWRIIDAVPNLMSATVVQLLPAAHDRLEAKRVKDVIRIFGHLNRKVNGVCLLIANQWSTTTRHDNEVKEYYKFGEEIGLIPRKDLAFTSDIVPDMKVGISRRMIHELFFLSNLFIFPTREESFGLVVPEAALHGVHMVLNRSLPMQFEVAGVSSAVFHDFGSYRSDHKQDLGDKYWSDIATIAIGRMQQSESIRAKSFARIRYNMDAIYKTQYEPLFAESKLWGEIARKP